MLYHEGTPWWEEEQSKRDVILSLMNRIGTDESKEAVSIADEVSDEIIFHKRVKKNWIESMIPIEET